MPVIVRRIPPGWQARSHHRSPGSQHHRRRVPAARRSFLGRHLPAGRCTVTPGCALRSLGKISAADRAGHSLLQRHIRSVESCRRPNFDLAGGAVGNAMLMQGEGSAGVTAPELAVLYRPAAANSSSTGSAYSAGAYMSVYLGAAALTPCGRKGWPGHHDQRRAWPGALAARAAPDARCTTWQSGPGKDSMAGAVGAGRQLVPARQPGSGPARAPAAAGQAIGPDSRGRQIRRH